MMLLKLLRSVRTAEKKSLLQPTSAPDAERNWGRTEVPLSISGKSLTKKKQLTMRHLSGKRKRAPRDAEIDETEKDDEVPVPTKPPAKKVPKGSEMTILHKFLRR